LSKPELCRIDAGTQSLSDQAGFARSSAAHRSASQGGRLFPGPPPVRRYHASVAVCALMDEVLAVTISRQAGPAIALRQYYPKIEI